MRKTALILATVLAAALPLGAAMAQTPDLRGAWKGKSEQVNAKTEFLERDVVVGVLDQKGNRFWGTTTHGGVTEKFVGVMRSDGKSFYWVDVDDNGIVEGIVMGPDKLETCYLEPGDHAIAACSILNRQK